MITSSGLLPRRTGRGRIGALRLGRDPGFCLGGRIRLDFSRPLLEKKSITRKVTPGPRNPEARTVISIICNHQSSRSLSARTRQARVRTAYIIENPENPPNRNQTNIPKCGTGKKVRRKCFAKFAKGCGNMPPRRLFGVVEVSVGVRGPSGGGVYGELGGSVSVVDGPRASARMLFLMVPRSRNKFLQKKRQ